MVDCKAFSQRRIKCHGVYGKMGEDCLHEELSEKRCLSLRHCARPAQEYYGKAPPQMHDEPHFLAKKALCASWAESFAYADKELEYGQEVSERHKKAREIVNNDRALKRECRDIAMNLAQCLRGKNLFGQR